METILKKKKKKDIKICLMEQLNSELNITYYSLRGHKMVGIFWRASRILVFQPLANPNCVVIFQEHSCGRWMGLGSTKPEESNGDDEMSPAQGYFYVPFAPEIKKQRRNAVK